MEPIQKQPEDERGTPRPEGGKPGGSRDIDPKAT
jgi:hypothetical protein